MCPQTETCPKEGSRGQKKTQKGHDMIYLASSWRNPFHTETLDFIRQLGYSCYDFKSENAFHWSAIDKQWKNWDPNVFKEALRHPVAHAGFMNDLGALRCAQACILLLPCGKSAHLEAGYAIGQGKPTAIYFPEPGRITWFEPELMYSMATDICLDRIELEAFLTKYCKEGSRGQKTPNTFDAE